MSVFDVSLIISDENPCKIFSNNLWNYGSSYTEGNINEVPFILSVLPWENGLMKNKKFLVFFLDLAPDILYRMIKCDLNRLSNNASYDIIWCNKELPFQKNEKANSVQSRSFSKTYEYLQTLSK